MQNSYIFNFWEIGSHTRWPGPRLSALIDPELWIFPSSPFESLDYRYIPPHSAVCGMDWTCSFVHTRQTFLYQLRYTSPMENSLLQTFLIQYTPTAASFPSAPPSPHPTDSLLLCFHLEKSRLPNDINQSQHF